MRRDHLELLASQSVTRRRRRYWTRYRLLVLLASIGVIAILWLFAQLLADAPPALTSDLFIGSNKVSEGSLDFAEPEEGRLPSLYSSAAAAPTNAADVAEMEARLARIADDWNERYR